MRLLGVDYGTKRIGIALSDEGAQFAMPLVVLKNTKDMAGLVREVADIAIKNGVTDIVLGESRNYKGEANSILDESLEFKNALETGFQDTYFIVHLEPEFMTSAQAEKFQGKNDMLDASAAALILQSYLDSYKNKN